MVCVAALLSGSAAYGASKYPADNWMRPLEKSPSDEFKGRIAYYSGNSLFDLCKKNEEACAIYIDGVNDGFFASTIGTNRDLAYCIPAGSTGPQVRDVVVQYLTNHPEERQRLASVLVAEALAHAWPQCEK